MIVRLSPHLLTIPSEDVIVETTMSPELRLVMSENSSRLGPAGRSPIWEFAAFSVPWLRVIYMGELVREH